jgi:hypothetical protein
MPLFPSEFNVNHTNIFTGLNFTLYKNLKFIWFVIHLYVHRLTTCINKVINKFTTIFCKKIFTNDVNNNDDGGGDDDHHVIWSFKLQKVYSACLFLVNYNI